MLTWASRWLLEVSKGWGGVEEHLSRNAAVREGTRRVLKGVDVKGNQGDLSPLGLLSQRLFRSSWRSLGYAGR